MLERIFDGSLMPHGHCLLWRYDLLFLYVIGDSLTFIAYAIIPIGLVYLVKKRDDLEFNWIFLLFAAFIFFCGLTHIINLINIWNGYYFIEGVFKFFTGVVSIITAVMLWRLMPKILLIPSVAILAQRNTELELAKVELVKSNESLEARVKIRTEELERLALTDELTKVNNRRRILELGEDELIRSSRYQHELSIMMIDIDHFKDINDDFGHQVGDKVLASVAMVLKKSIRETDFLGRYGGEEFLIICPETDKNMTRHLAERIRENVEALDIDTAVTCSIGVAIWQKEQSLYNLIREADTALYEAKDAGRNNVKIHCD